MVLLLVDMLLSFSFILCVGSFFLIACLCQRSLTVVAVGFWSCFVFVFIECSCSVIGD